MLSGSRCKRGRAKPALAPNPRVASIESVAEPDAPLAQQLEEIGTQLDWVRDYL